MELPSLDTMVLLLVMVVLARVAGELLVRRKQSPVAGEVIVGILLGPYVLGLVDPSRDPLQMAEIRGIAELGVFFLIFNAGVELFPDTDPQYAFATIEALTPPFLAKAWSSMWNA